MEFLFRLKREKSCRDREPKNKTESVAFELYDYRVPYGPNLNPILAALVRFVLPTAWRKGGSWLIEEQPEKVLSPAAE
jgi:hypothetical protein